MVSKLNTDPSRHAGVHTIKVKVVFNTGTIIAWCTYHSISLISSYCTTKYRGQRTSRDTRENKSILYFLEITCLHFSLHMTLSGTATAESLLTVTDTPVSLKVFQSGCRGWIKRACSQQVTIMPCLKESGCRHYVI